ncbi:hypothetical protein D9758_015709 [Tetrapyrgos nigripes]|uniref:Hydrophobic surface binding protein n=1 Tax=Tetrapyrgos nigripes TaxID=182062 RepID=A0A8H5C9Y9_9AGAR|nr:hypothetical protein D9758_015709 [Tetrapyrgos nigripes]
MKRFIGVVYLVLAAVGIAIGTTVTQVEADLKALAAQVTTLDKSINAFPDANGTEFQALLLHNSAYKLAVALQATEKDINSTTSVTKADAKAILDAINGLKPTIFDALNTTVIKKDAFVDLKFGSITGLVVQDLNYLDSATWELGNALIAASPDDFKSQARSLQAEISAAFDSAKEAYRE